MEEEKREKTGNREWVSMSGERERERERESGDERDTPIGSYIGGIASKQAADRFGDSAENPTARYRARNVHLLYMQYL